MEINLLSSLSKIKRSINERKKNKSKKQLSSQKKFCY